MLATNDFKNVLLENGLLHDRTIDQCWTRMADDGGQVGRAFYSWAMISHTVDP